MDGYTLAGDARSNPHPNHSFKIRVRDALRAADERGVTRPPRGVPEERVFDPHQRFLL
jgi:hypothetical protein